MRKMFGPKEEKTRAKVLIAASVTSLQLSPFFLGMNKVNLTLIYIFQLGISLCSSRYLR